MLKEPRAGPEQGVTVAALALLSALAVDADGPEAALAAGVVPAAVRLLRAPELDLVRPSGLECFACTSPVLSQESLAGARCTWVTCSCPASPSTSWSPKAWPPSFDRDTPKHVGASSAACLYRPVGGWR